MLRDQMRKSGVDAFLFRVPMCIRANMWPLLMNVWHGLRGLQDRLVLCRYTGCAGVFVDGRYRVQVKEQTRAPLPPLIGPKCNWGIG